MSEIVLSEREFRDKVYACWLGKNIGGTLGAPHEGKRYVLGLDYYDPVPDEAAANDDLDLQLVWLRCIEDCGTDPSVAQLAEYWSLYAASYPWNEYGFFMRNYSRGLRPPVAGCFENYFVDEMGSPIRSEIWAVLHPGDPQAAARMAWKDSALDHAGGEGTWGEMFWAALQAAAFVETDPLTLIRIGLNMIPLSSHIARSIREALWCHENGVAWGDARERIASRFGHVQACNAIPNHGFTIIGWLYGEDFGSRLCKAVNCGYDTDCTGATLGATLGIIGGSEAIDANWRRPVGDHITLHKYTQLPGAPTTITELTDRSIAMARKAVEAKDSVSFAGQTALPADLYTRLFRNDQAVAARGQDNHMSVELLDGREVEFHYGGEPVLRPGVGKTVNVTVDGRVEPVDLVAPATWTCRRLGDAEFELCHDGDVAGRNELNVTVGGKSVGFTILGPREAKGFAAGENVEKCPRCHARIEACICNV